MDVMNLRPHLVHLFNTGLLRERAASESWGQVSGVDSRELPSEESGVDDRDSWSVTRPGVCGTLVGEDFSAAAVSL